MKRRTFVTTLIIFILLLFSPIVAKGVPPHPDVLKRLKEDKTWMNKVSSMLKRIRKDYSPPIEAKATIGDLQIVVLLVDFKDNPYTIDPGRFADMLFSLGTYSTGSLRDYYRESSYNQLDITGDVYGWYSAPSSYSYYVNNQSGLGTYSQNAQRLVEDAVAVADDAGVDFSQYSKDANGYVFLIVIHAGIGAEEVESNPDEAKQHIWSHSWVTYYSDIVVDGVKIYPYIMCPEECMTDIAHIGVYCHELGHRFGLPDLYDTDLSSAGLGNWSLMASGSWGNDGNTPVHCDPWSKIQLGWVIPTTVFTNLCDKSISQVEFSPDIYKLWREGKPYNEYFLVENRQRVGFDKGLPGSGILIYHVDETMPDNDDESHYLVGLEQADGNFDLEHENNRGDWRDPWVGPDKTFDYYSIPNSRSYSGKNTDVTITVNTPSSSIMKVDLKISPFEVIVYPNPFRPTKSTMNAMKFINIPVGGGVKIYTIVGEEVCTLYDDDNNGEVEWSGRNASGKKVGSGLYLYCIKFSNRTITGKVSIIW